MRATPWWGLLLAQLVGCAPSAGRTAGQPPPPDTSTTPQRITLVENDPDAARAKAQREGKLLFVDAWAPWCHSCQSLREEVLPDPRLAPLESRYVFASVDTEREQARAFLDAHPVRVWPTLFVEDPRSGRALLRWEGTATATELAALLETVASPDAASQDFVTGLRQRASGEAGSAQVSLQRAFAAAGPRSALRAHSLEALLQLQVAQRWFEPCAKLAEEHAELLLDGTSKASVLALGLHCAAEVQRPTAPLTAIAERFLQSPESHTLLCDDRASVRDAVLDALRARQPERVGAWARAWSRELEDCAERASTPAARAVLDGHRLQALLELGEPGRAVTLLQARSQELPQDYTTWARLARALTAAGRMPEAARAIDRAVGLVQGPRSLRILVQRAEIQHAMGQREEARRSLEDARRLADTLALAADDRRRTDVDRARTRLMTDEHHAD